MKEGKGDDYQDASNSNGVTAAMVRSAGPEASAPTETREAGGGGQGWAGKWAYVGKGGKMAGKRTGFAHIAPGSTRLGPDNSMQVVDFQHLTHVRLFWGSPEIGKKTVTNVAKPGTEGSLRAEHNSRINHIYASRYIDFYACNSDLRGYAA